MRYTYKFILLFPLLILINFLLNSLYLKKKKSLRIISYHNLNVNNEKDFERQICWLKDNWNIITPEDFVKIMEGKLKGSNKDVLITFDDGYKSILKPLVEKIRPKVDRYRTSRLLSRRRRGTCVSVSPVHRHSLQNHLWRLQSRNLE